MGWKPRALNEQLNKILQGPAPKCAPGKPSAAPVVRMDGNEVGLHPRSICPPAVPQVSLSEGTCTQSLSTRTGKSLVGNQVSSHTGMVLYKQEFSVSVLPLTTFKDKITLPSDNTKQRSGSHPPETYSQTSLVFFFSNEESFLFGTIFMK